MTRRQTGFTLIEGSIVTALFGLIMVAVLGTSGVIGETVNTSEQRSGVAEALRTMSTRIRQVLRPAAASTLKTQALQMDIDEALFTRQEMITEANLAMDSLALAEAQAYPIPAKKEWIFPSFFVQRRSVQFRAAPGKLSMNLNNLTTTRNLEFLMDPAETQNGIDDDGDGWVDEGRLYLTYESIRILLGEDLETCEFSMEGGVLTLKLTCAKMDKKGRFHRMTQVQMINMRNN